ncbi:MAG TPA: hypothetical protein VHX60_07675 [Acidobacteriaceae bacterium]|jgi:hypothetical protein|nr:hypothetical protein [Acidobacteriaceae bacterium]
MKRSPFFVLSALAVCALALPPSPASAQLSSLPQLGAPAPATIFASEKHLKQCETGPGHKDPCAEIELTGTKIKFIVAWDAQTKAITYLFTNDPRVVTDTQLSYGGTCRVVSDSGQPDPATPYMKWVIDPKWKGPDTLLTGKAVWYAAIHKDSFDPTYGDIVGLVQSRYIQLK